MANVLRPAILGAARSDRLKRTISGAPVTKRIVDRFIAGEQRSDVIAIVRSLVASGRAVSVDYLGEHTTARANADAVVAEYLLLLDELAAIGAEPIGGVPALEVSVKLTALGQEFDTALAAANLRTICAAAAERGIWVTVDAEDHTTTASTQDIAAAARAEFPWLGVVVQAYLHRSSDDCRALTGPGVRVRLCKGAYDEPASVAYRGRREIDAAYVRCLDVLVHGDGYPMIASHDPVIIARAATRTGGEYQMLYGIRDLEQRRIAATGATMRVYVPYGAEWYGYFMRRLAERPSNLRFFLRSLVTRG